MQDNNSEKFSDALPEFIKSSEKIVLTADAPDSRDSLEKLCRVLGIAGLELVHTVPGRANKLFLRDLNRTLYSDGAWDESRPYTVSKTHEDGCVSNYVVYPRKDGGEWSDEDKRRIDAFISAVFLVNDRERIAAIAEKFAIMDNEMDI